MAVNYYSQMIIGNNNNIAVNGAVSVHGVAVDAGKLVQIIAEQADVIKTMTETIRVLATSKK